MYSSSTDSGHQMGIRQKILLILASVLVVSLTIHGWLILDEQREEALSDLRHRGADISHFLAKAVAYSVIGYDYHTLQLLMNEIVATEAVNHARVTNLAGKTMAEAGNPHDPDTLTFEQPVQLEGEVIGHLVLGMSTRPLHRRLAEHHVSLFSRQMLIILLIILGELLALSWFIVRPVRRMITVLDSSDEDDPPRLPVTSRDEFGQLASRFNHLVDRLRQANRRLRHDAHRSGAELDVSREQIREQAAELRRIQRELHRLSRLDDLTSAFTRRYFNERMDEAVELANEQGEPVSLILVDIDHLKIVNDVHGHHVGDRLLQIVARTLQDALRESDQLFRICGGEFAVLAWHTGAETATWEAEQLRKAVENIALELDDKTLHPTVSLGVATIPDRGRETTRDYFYLCADRALYHAKQHGRNQVVHCHALNLEPITQLTDREP